MTGWALVLGGGGPVGVAWYAGLADGLRSQGVLLSDADVILGTSAGAKAGAWLASGEPLEAFLDAVVREATDLHRTNYADGLNLERVGEIYAALGAATAPLESDVRRRIGALAKTVPPQRGDDDWFVKSFEPYVPDVPWPAKLRAVAVNADTGAVRLIGPDDSIPLARGVAASCAAPGIISPVRLPEGQFVDGGARSATNADLVDRFRVERCLAVSPIVADAPMVGEATARVLEEEATRLRAKGIAVSMLLPTELEADAFGFDLLDLTKVDAAIEAGRARGRLEADRLRAPRG
jgi:NTE family protein